MMRYILKLFLSALLLTTLQINLLNAKEINQNWKNKMSHMKIKIESKNGSAIFQLYDTVGAKQFFMQLPLTLDLENFRDAQWMFFPPKKLEVTHEEAYHDGKKGELSYYAPWGDVFMLYKDFYAGDEMHHLGVCIDGIENIEGMRNQITITKYEEK